MGYLHTLAGTQPYYKLWRVHTLEGVLGIFQCQQGASGRPEDPRASSTAYNISASPARCVGRGGGVVSYGPWNLVNGLHILGSGRQQQRPRACLGLVMDEAWTRVNIQAPASPARPDRQVFQGDLPSAKAGTHMSQQRAMILWNSLVPDLPHAGFQLRTRWQTKPEPTPKGRLDSRVSQLYSRLQKLVG